MQGLTVRVGLTTLVLPSIAVPHATRKSADACSTSIYLHTNGQKS